MIFLKKFSEKTAYRTFIVDKSCLSTISSEFFLKKCLNIPKDSFSEAQNEICFQLTFCQKKISWQNLNFCNFNRGLKTANCFFFLCFWLIFSKKSQFLG